MINSKTQGKIPQKLPGDPNMLMINHTKFHTILTRISHAKKSIKLASRGVTPIVTPKFEKL
jgi:hypothetical protein